MAKFVFGDRFDCDCVRHHAFTVERRFPELAEKDRDWQRCAKAIGLRDRLSKPVGGFVRFCLC